MTTRLKIKLRGFWKDDMIIFNVESYDVTYLVNSNMQKITVKTNRYNRVMYFNNDAIESIIYKELIEK